jgi:SAM-dependent methyltransferase
VPTNERERQRWNDRRWTDAWLQREQLTSAITPTLLGALDPQAGERVLDVGCGGGRATIELARAVGPDGWVVGVDLSVALTTLARGRADDAGLAHISFEIADAQTEPLCDRPFDAITSQFGVMFFDEPTVAFDNLRRHLRPHGRLVFACWGPAERNRWHARTALGNLVPAPPAPAEGTFQPGPFSLGDVGATKAMLRDAGFDGVRHVEHDLTVRAPASAVFDDSQLDFFGVPDTRRAEAQTAIAEHLARFSEGEGLYAFPMSFLIVSGRVA